MRGIRNVGRCSSEVNDSALLGACGEEKHCPGCITRFRFYLLQNAMNGKSYLKLKQKFERLEKLSYLSNSIGSCRTGWCSRPRFSAVGVENHSEDSDADYR